MHSLKNKAVNGMIWTTVERLAAQVIQFIISLIIARILSPSDYGVIGMLAIFMAIATSFLDSGFANALIQKKDRTEIDYSTVFYFNIIAALLLYAIFYISAPWIAAFYNLPLLCNVARVYSLSLIIGAFTIVQTTKLTIDLNFRLQAAISICSVFISGICGVYLAYCNYGVWALVFQGLIFNSLRLILLWVFAKWMPLLAFSMHSFKRLFSFGSKLLLSGMINTIYDNIYTIVIGKSYNASDVGFFNRGKHFAELPAQTASAVLLKVSYPLLSSLQDNRDKLLTAYTKMMRTAAFMVFPLLFGIAASAHPIVLFLLGEKWLTCVPILQVLCFCYIWHPLTHINLNLLYVRGRSDLVLKLELIKKPVAFIILFASLPFGILWMCVGRVCYSIFAFIINCYYTGKILNYGIRLQSKCIYPILIYSSVMYLCVTLVIPLFSSIPIQIVSGLVTGIVSYLAIAFIAKDSSLNELYRLLMTKKQKNKL